MTNALNKNITLKIQGLQRGDFNASTIDGYRWQNIEPVYSYDNSNWSRVPLNGISYTAPGCTDATCHYNITFTPTNNTVWLAPVPPYTVSMRDALYNSYAGNPNLTVENLGTLPEGHNLTLVRITDNSVDNATKKKIYVIAQQHSFETGSWIGEGMIRYLMNTTDSTANILRRNYIFKIELITNVEGVYYGRSRMTPIRSGAQYDLNRMWSYTPIPNSSVPEVNWTYANILAFAPDAFIDLHSTINDNSATQPHNSAHFYFSGSSTASANQTFFMNNVSGGHDYSHDYWPETNNGGGRQSGTANSSSTNVNSRLGVELSFMMEHPHDNITNSTSPLNLHVFYRNPQNQTDWINWGKKIPLGIHDYFNNTANENSLPTITLISPSDNNASTNRMPNFTWVGSDADGDPLIYRINITSVIPGPCDDDRLVNVNNFQYYSLNESNYLKCLADELYNYIWTVGVSEDSGVNYIWSPERRFNVSSLVDLTLPNNSVNFGSMQIGEINDTIDNNPYPLVIENLGNVWVNISLNASSLWSAPNLNPTNYFTFKIDNTTELGSFNWSSSRITFTTVPNSTNALLAILNFSWLDSHDSAEIDLNVTVPFESPGPRNSTINFIGSRIPNEY